MQENILIVGTGAMGSLFAARLAQAGYAVTMLGTWKEGLDAIRSNGVRLIDAGGEEHRLAVHATDDPRECSGARHALVLVKAWQTERAARQLAECLAAGWARRHPSERAWEPRNAHPKPGTGSRCPGQSPPLEQRCSAAGRVKAGGEGPISIERNPALGPLEEALRSANFNVQIVEDARSLVWGKLVINSAINPLTALLRVPNGELLERPTARELMRTLAHETAQVARAEKIDLSFSDPAAAAEDVARRTATNRSSMLQDIERGAPTEIDAICGAIVRNCAKTRSSHSCQLGLLAAGQGTPPVIGDDILLPSWCVLLYLLNFIA